MHQAHHTLRSALAALRGPQFVILALALGLAFAWFGPAALALGLPFALMLIPRRPLINRQTQGQPSPAGQMAEMATTLDQRLRGARRAGQPVLCITIAIPGFDAVPRAAGERMVTSCLDSLAHALRRDDALFDLGDGLFGVIVGGARGMDTTTARRLAMRLQGHVQTCLSAIHDTEGLSAMVGVSLDSRPGTRNGRMMIAESLKATAPQPSFEAD